MAKYFHFLLLSVFQTHLFVIFKTRIVLFQQKLMFVWIVQFTNTYSTKYFFENWKFIINGYCSEMHIDFIFRFNSSKPSEIKSEPKPKSSELFGAQCSDFGISVSFNFSDGSCERMIENGPLTFFYDIPNTMIKPFFHLFFICKNWTLTLKWSRFFFHLNRNQNTHNALAIDP